MLKFYDACGKIAELMLISGKNDKQAFVTEHAQDTLFLDLLEARLNPYRQYKMNKIPSYTPIEEPDFGFDDFITLLHVLSSSNINNKLRADVVDAMSRTDTRYAYILEGIITKTLNLGIDTGVNKALGYKLIPTFNVMLAASLKEGMEAPIPCQVDQKYDGVRAIGVIKDHQCTLFTRKGRVLTFPKIEADLLELSLGSNLTFDTELEMEARTGISGVCNHNLKKGYVKDSDDIITCTVFDMMTTEQFEAEDCPTIQSERTLQLQKLFMNVDLPRVKLAKSQTVFSMDKLLEINKEYIDAGYEGIIAKDPDAPYFFKRNRAWLKLKALNSVTLKIVGIEEGKGKRKDKVGALLCESAEGKVKVKVGSGLTDEMVDLFTDKPPIGKFAEVLFNVLIKGEDSEVYSLFLPRLKAGEGIRIDKTEADSFDKILDTHIGKPEI